MNGFCAGLVLTVGGGGSGSRHFFNFFYLRITICFFCSIPNGERWSLFIYYSCLCVHFNGVSQSFFYLGYAFCLLFISCFIYQVGRILNLSFPAYRCIRIFFCLPFSSLLSYLLLRVGLVHFHWSRVRIGSHDF
ncbi:hypothetical protein HOY82DRAFT_140961 [Tuber indicum]|nr:hypothetical protein HOY82DRAFT_140961 [Tuber indicum]